MKMFRALVGLLMVCLIATTVAIAAVPGTITYQGRLTDQPGTALNGNVNIVFSIYSAASGGAALWQETQSGVPVQKGLFTVELGAVTPFSPTLFTGADLYLGVKVGTDAEMTPRQKLNSVPFAVKAATADSVDWTTIANVPAGFSDGTDDSYSDAQAVAAIKAADGAGSTLDADLVDGQHAADIIAAASDEVRTPISACGYISPSGSYYLTRNLTATGSCFNVGADNVTIDLMGFTITGPGSASGINSGINMNGRVNVEIRNGTITAFGQYGIGEISPGSKGHRVINVRVSDNGNDGIVLSGKGHLIKDCTTFNNGGGGIWTIEAIVAGNTAFNNSSRGIYGGAGSIITGNRVYSNGNSGIQSNGGIIKDNTIYANNTTNTAGEGGLKISSNCRVVGNAVNSNNQNGIYVNGTDNILRENHVTNSKNGILFDASGNYYKENTASGNTDNFNLNGTTQTDGGGNVGF